MTPSYCSCLWITFTFRPYITAGAGIPITAIVAISSRLTTAAVASSRDFRFSSASVKM